MKIPAFYYKCDLCREEWRASILDERGKEVYGDSWIHTETVDICRNCRAVVEHAIEKDLVEVVKAVKAA